MREDCAITKEQINSVFGKELIDYINSLIQKNEGNELFEINEYIINLRNLIERLEVDSVNQVLIEREFDFKELYKELDYTVEVSNEEMIFRVIELFIARELLKVFPFIQKENDKYDVFLSHCSWDAREVLGIKIILEKQFKLSAYVDWIDDKQANFPRAIEKIIEVIEQVGDREVLVKINKIYKKSMLKERGKKGIKTTDQYISNLLINNIKNSKSVFYIQSRHYDHSRWMPYELGLAEAGNKIIYRLPIKYVKTRKRFGKRSGFLVKYDSIIGNDEKFRKDELKKIIS